MLASVKRYAAQGLDITFKPQYLPGNQRNERDGSYTHTGDKRKEAGLPFSGQSDHFHLFRR